ncbi:Penicillinase repressor [Rubripirellula lacrimiformis]|uniref:Penicillinase repressor n=1 Tax=Rubripirellula lacrimiformis TaxID=1930273 RepID=A0A517NHA7_9BACT|nr:BlaI/MecI/CopY family transcriptional regulator [Rubripirellula lacrimiformis]QDT06458.1 Penicillinase repressor [Rubripirellula lacrimiformis]
MVRAELSRRERQIVDILFKVEEASAASIRAVMPDPPSDATVRTILRILEQKGVVKHRRDGKRFLYCVCKSKSGEGKSAIRRVLDIFYGGSVEQALAAHLSDPKANLDTEQLQRLRRLIDDAASQKESGQ